MSVVSAIAFLVELCKLETVFKLNDARDHTTHTAATLWGLVVIDYHSSDKILYLNGECSPQCSLQSDIVLVASRTSDLWSWSAKARLSEA